MTIPTKACTGCGHHYPVESYTLAKRNGKPYRLPKCHGCRNAIDRERWAARQAVVSAAAKKRTNPLNQRASLWFGPVNRQEPLRWRA